MNLLKRVINVFSYWAFVFSSPIWVIPALIHGVAERGEFTDRFILGKFALFEKRIKVKNE